MHLLRISLAKGKTVEQINLEFWEVPASIAGTGQTPKAKVHGSILRTQLNRLKMSRGKTHNNRRPYYKEGVKAREAEVDTETRPNYSS